MNRWFAREVLYPIHEKLRGRRTLAFATQFRPSESLSVEALAERRDKALAELVEHAARRVPFWRRIFEEQNWKPDLVRGAEELRQLPTMDKAVIRANLDDLVAENWRDRVFKLETGGSSGEPLIFWADKDRESAALAAKIRCREWFGVRLGDRQMDLWGSPIELGASDRFRQMKDRWLNFRMLSAFRLSDEDMLGFLGELEDQGTDFVYGYSSVLARYARFLESRGEDLHHLALKAAIGTAEMMFDDDREVIGRVFGCPVANEYGCRDGGYIAQECPEGGLHLNEDVTYVEILDEEGNPVPDGVVGEVTVTNLWSFGSPLIRYRLGDRASRSVQGCPCGRSLPLLSSLGGRISDTLLTPTGNRVHGLGVIYVVRELPGVSRFQIIQDRIDRLRVLIVPEESASPESLRGPVESGMREVMGEGVTVDVEFVDDIAPLASGKTRSVVCLVDESAPRA